jgi:ABC-type transport system involved in multi-copper enzyme maturation permease subunit
MGFSLLHYREWQGRFDRPARSVWPIARTALLMIFQRKVFWVLYALALTIFFMFFFGQYLLDWAESQTAETSIRVGFIRTQPGQFIEILRNSLKFNGQPEMYRNFFWWQGTMVLIVLALAGSILVGNDFQYGSLPFYLSKPLGRWHYLAGKCLAVAVFVNLMTTVPALILFVQFAFLKSWDYLFTGGYVIGHVSLFGTDLDIRLLNPLFWSILAYGLVLTVVLSLMLVATAGWLRRTVPMIMVWMSVFFFLHFLTEALVVWLQYPAGWRLLDLWNNTNLIGSYFLKVRPYGLRPDRQPSAGEAALVLGAVCLVCLIYLNRRIRAVEIVR